jgi:hypothetical protein
MAGIGGCRSSWAMIVDTQILKGQGKVMSIHGMATGTDTALIHLYDVAASGDADASNMIGMLYVNTVARGTSYAEADLHGVLFKLGLFADITHVSGTATAFTVEFN